MIPWLSVVGYIMISILYTGKACWQGMQEPLTQLWACIGALKARRKGICITTVTIFCRQEARLRDWWAMNRLCEMKVTIVKQYMGMSTFQANVFKRDMLTNLCWWKAVGGLLRVDESQESIQHCIILSSACDNTLLHAHNLLQKSIFVSHNIWL